MSVVAETEESEAEILVGLIMVKSNATVHPQGIGELLLKDCRNSRFGEQLRYRGAQNAPQPSPGG